MKQANDFMIDMLDLDLPEASEDILWRACRPTKIDTLSNGDIVITIPFQAQKPGLSVEADLEVPRREYSLRIRAYESDVLRLSISFKGEMPGDDSPMLDSTYFPCMDPLTVETTDSGWIILDSRKVVRMRINIKRTPYQRME